MSDTPGLMCVHAHPDDEAIWTGGILAKYAAEGVRTAVVTCTDGFSTVGKSFAPAMDEQVKCRLTCHLATLDLPL